MGAFESGQSLLASVLAKLPESHRAQAEALFNSAEAKDAVTLVGDSALARSDYSKQMDALRSSTTELQQKEQQLVSEFDRLNQWYEVNKSALDDYKTIKANGGGHPNPDPRAPAPPAKPDAVSAADLQRLFDERFSDASRDVVALTAFISTQAGRHYAMFGEPLDATEIAANPKLGRPVAGQPNRIFSLQDAYNEKFGEKVAAKQKEADDKKFNDEVERRLSEERKKLVSGHPFPLRGDAPSVLDILQTKDGPAQHTLDTAVAEYERLQSSRGV